MSFGSKGSFHSLPFDKTKTQAQQNLAPEDVDRSAGPSSAFAPEGLRPDKPDSVAQQRQVPVTYKELPEYLRDYRVKGLPLRIRELANARGWSIYELAKRADIPEQTLYPWVRGEVLPNLPNALILAQVLGCRVEDLVLTAP